MTQEQQKSRNLKQKERNVLATLGFVFIGKGLTYKEQEDIFLAATDYSKEEADGIRWMKMSYAHLIAEYKKRYKKTFTHKTFTGYLKGLESDGLIVISSFLVGKAPNAYGITPKGWQTFIKRHHVGLASKTPKNKCRPSSPGEIPHQKTTPNNKERNNKSGRAGAYESGVKNSPNQFPLVVRMHRLASDILGADKVGPLTSNMSRFLMANYKRHDGNMDSFERYLKSVASRKWLTSQAWFSIWWVLKFTNADRIMRGELKDKKPFDFTAKREKKTENTTYLVHVDELYKASVAILGEEKAGKLDRKLSAHLRMACNKLGGTLEAFVDYLKKVMEWKWIVAKEYFNLKWALRFKSIDSVLEGAWRRFEKGVAEVFTKISDPIAIAANRIVSHFLRTRELPIDATKEQVEYISQTSINPYLAKDISEKYIEYHQRDKT